METNIERELEHIRGLVVIRDALAARGASALELKRCDRTIGQAKERLARMVARVA